MGKRADCADCADQSALLFEAGANFKRLYADFRCFSFSASFYVLFGAVSGWCQYLCFFHV